MTDMTDVTMDRGSGGRLEVVIAGAGVAGLEAAFALRELTGDGVGVTLLAPTDEFIYRPMAVGEPFTSGWARHYPLARLAAEAGAELRHDALVGVDAEHGIVRTAGGSELRYDALLVCLGASAHARYEHVTTVDERHMDVVTSAYCEVPKAKTVTIHPGATTLTVDRLVALPELRGPQVRGLPHDREGFVPIDEYGRVRGVDRVWAAGDATDFPVKHGGVSAQLADSIAQSVAALAGACPGPSPFEPVLEGVLVTGGTPRYLRGRATGGHGAESELTEVSRRTAPVKI